MNKMLTRLRQFRSALVNIFIRSPVQLKAINGNALESSNENSLIVANIMDTMSKHSAAQANHNHFVGTLFLDSFLPA